MENRRNQNRGMITRNFLTHKVYDIFNVENGEYLETIACKGKLSLKDIATKHNVKQVYSQLKESHYTLYGMETDIFMEYANVLETEIIEE